MKSSLVRDLHTAYSPGFGRRTAGHEGVLAVGWPAHRPGVNPVQAALKASQPCTDCQKRCCYCYRQRRHPVVAAIFCYPSHVRIPHFFYRNFEICFQVCPNCASDKFCFFPHSTMKECCSERASSLICLPVRHNYKDVGHNIIFWSHSLVASAPAILDKSLIIFPALGMVDNVFVEVDWIHDAV